MKDIGGGNLYIGSVDQKKKRPEGFGILASSNTKSIHQGYFTKGRAEGPGILFHGKGPLKGSKVVGHFNKGIP